jgi:hypothetical protein
MGPRVSLNAVDKRKFFWSCQESNPAVSIPNELCSCLSMRKQVSHPLHTADEIVVLYILVFTLTDSRK